MVDWNGLPEKTFIFVGHAEDDFKSWCLLSHGRKIAGLPGPAAEWVAEAGAVVIGPREWVTSSLVQRLCPGQCGSSR